MSPTDYEIARLMFWAITAFIVLAVFFAIKERNK